MNETESGWLIETRRNGYPEWARFEEGGVVWTTDSLKACRFARREDAEQLAYGENCDAITEHSWPDVPPIRPGSKKRPTMTSREPWPGEREAKKEALDRMDPVTEDLWDACMEWMETAIVTPSDLPNLCGIWEYGDHNGLTVMRFPNIPPNEAAWSGYLPTHWRYLGPCGTIAQDPEPELPPCDKGHKPIKSGGTILCYHADDEYGCMHLLMAREHWLRLFPLPPREFV